MSWWLCVKCNDWHSLPEVPFTTICPRNNTHGAMSGPHSNRDPGLVNELKVHQPRRPSIERIDQFFQKNTVPKAPAGDHEMNFVLFESNKETYYNEFLERMRKLVNGIKDEDVVHLWELMIKCFSLKDVRYAKEFLTESTRLGLEPLENQSARIFWSGTNSRAMAYQQSSDEATALEKTNVGTLLDKLSVFKAVPWGLSTLLWALVSRTFSMGATGDMHVYLDGGFAKGNVFWNDELPALRLMQRYGAVRDILINIWHTKDNRWLPEFSINSDKLLLVFDKGKRVPAPTSEDPNATRSFRYDKPIKIANLRRMFEKYLMDSQRAHPLVFYNFRLDTCIYALIKAKTVPLEIEFFEYDSPAMKELTVHANNFTDAFAILPSIEKFLMANYTHITQMPARLVYQQDAILDQETMKILVLRLQPDPTWYYKLSFQRKFACSQEKGVSLIQAIAKTAYLIRKYGQYNKTTINLDVMHKLLADLFDNSPGMGLNLDQRLAAIRLIRSSYGT